MEQIFNGILYTSLMGANSSINNTSLSISLKGRVETLKNSWIYVQRLTLKVYNIRCYIL